MKNKNVSIDIIIATKNRPNLLRKAIQSVINQTFQNFYIAVTNDGGENVEHIINEFNDPRIYYFQHDISLGLSQARNTGIKNLNSQFLTCLDDDDVLGKWHLEFLVRYLTELNYEIVYTNAIRNIMQKDKNGIYQSVAKDIPYDIDFNFDLILVQNITPVESVGFSRKSIEEIGLFDSTLSRYEDWDAWIKISRKYPMLHIPIPTCEFTWRNDLDGTSMSSTPDNLFTTLLPIIYERYWETAHDKVWTCKAMNSVLKSRGLPEMFSFKQIEEDVKSE